MVPKFACLLFLMGLLAPLSAAGSLGAEHDGSDIAVKTVPTLPPARLPVDLRSEHQRRASKPKGSSGDSSGNSSSTTNPSAATRPAGSLVLGAGVAGVAVALVAHCL